MRKIICDGCGCEISAHLANSTNLYSTNLYSFKSTTMLGTVVKVDMLLNPGIDLCRTCTASEVTFATDANFNPPEVATGG